MAAARLKKGTAQLFRLANLARIFVNLSLYDSTVYTVQCTCLLYLLTFGIHNRSSKVKSVEAYHTYFWSPYLYTGNNECKKQNVIEISASKLLIWNCGVSRHLDSRELQCMSRYSVCRDTMYVEIHCISRYNVCQGTVYIEIQCMSRYIVYRGTMYVEINCVEVQCMSRYSVCRDTVYVEIQCISRYIMSVAWKG